MRRGSSAGPDDEVSLETFAIAFCICYQVVAAGLVLAARATGVALDKSFFLGPLRWALQPKQGGANRTHSPFTDEVQMLRGIWTG